jgi:hypothetical protein
MEKTLGREGRLAGGDISDRLIWLKNGSYSRQYQAPIELIERKDIIHFGPYCHCWGIIFQRWQPFS